MSEGDIPQPFICQAYHQAGHVVAAARLGIGIRKVSIVTIEEEPPGTWLAPLGEVIKPARTRRDLIAIVENYVVARLAGPAAEMIRSAHRFKAKGHSVSWSRWRKRWRNRLEREEDVDIDFALAASFAWSDFETMAELDDRFMSLWKRAEELLRDKATWRKLEVLVQALLRLDVLTGSEAIGLLKSA